MATHSSVLAWKIPGTGEPGGLPSMGSHRVGHDWSDFTFTFHFDALEKETATHSSVLAWRIPATEEPGGLPSMGSHRVGHDWSDLAAAAAAATPTDFTCGLWLFYLCNIRVEKLQQETKDPYSGQNNCLQRYPCPNSRNLWMLTYMAKETLQMWLSIWDGKIILGYLGESSIRVRRGEGYKDVVLLALKREEGAVI